MDSHCHLAKLFRLKSLLRTAYCKLQITLCPTLQLLAFSLAPPPLPRQITNIVHIAHLEWLTRLAVTYCSLGSGMVSVATKCPGQWWWYC